MTKMALTFIFEQVAACSILRRLEADTKIKENLTRELLFADDAALVLYTESVLQRITSYSAFRT